MKTTEKNYDAELRQIRDQAIDALRRMTPAELAMTFLPSEIARFRNAGLLPPETPRATS